MSEAGPQLRQRGAAEWVTLGLTGAVLASVLTVLVVLSFGSGRPAAPTVSVAHDVRERDGRFFVTVEVRNEGDTAAADVQVLAELADPAGAQSSEQVIDFLGGSETETLTFVFAKDPASAPLRVAIGSFSDP